MPAELLMPLAVQDDIASLQHGNFQEVVCNESVCVWGGRGGGQENLLQTRADMYFGCLAWNGLCGNGVEVRASKKGKASCKSM
jgi:hypothetical protein